MATIQTREEQALKTAFAEFGADETDSAVKALVGKTAKIFGWNPEQAKTRMQELVWEIGLLLAKGTRLTEETFLKYAASVHENGFVPVALRP